jgi:hypothetical protein
MSGKPAGGCGVVQESEMASNVQQLMQHSSRNALPVFSTPVDDATEMHQSASSQSLARVLTGPRGSVCLMYGDKVVFPIALHMAAHAMSHGISIATIDGCNRFNVHLLARYAREHRIDPQAFLNRIYVSRGFTCYQMEAAITRRLLPFLRAKNARAAIILGLLETFYDEQAPFREVTQMIERVIGALHEIKAGGISVLLPCVDVKVSPEERNRLFTRLKSGADSIYKVTTNEQHAPVVVHESAAGNRTVGDGRHTPLHVIQP